MNIEWDDHIGKLDEKWRKIVADIQQFSEIEITRCYFICDMNDPVISCYLHGFSDSSNEAYAACVYIKSVTRSNNIKVELVAAKSRLVPLRKKLTIPRLELSKLMVSVRDALRGEIKNIEDWCWSDSTITLSWIKAENLEFKPFVENRLRIIRKNITPVRWNHCRSAENPSDIITRFNSCNLNSNDLWWHGPEFLKEIIETDLFQKAAEETPTHLQNFLTLRMTHRVKTSKLDVQQQ